MNAASVRTRAGDRCGSPSHQNGRAFAIAAAKLLALIFVALLGIVRPTRAPAQSQADEYELKAAYLFHFAQFIEWPPEALKNSDNTFLICIVGEDPFHGDLRRIVQGKLVADKVVRVQNIKRLQDAQGCHILFIDNNESKRTSLTVGGLRSSPVLTVGESDDFLAQGGIIRFSLEDRKIRFEINQDAAGNAKLKVSSRLLLLAKSVVSGGGQK